MRFFTLLLFSLFSIFSVAQQRYVWNGSSSNQFNDSLNWNPTGIPQITDTVFVNLSNTGGVLSTTGDIAVAKLDLLNGELIAGGNIRVVGTWNFRNATVVGMPFQIEAGQLNLGGNNKPVTINPDIAITAASIRLEEATFKGNTEIQKTGNANDFCGGGNTFEQSLNLFLDGMGNLTLAGSKGDTFEGPVNLSISNASQLQLAFKGNNSFAQNITILRLDGAFKMGQSGGSSNLLGDASIEFGEPGFIGGDFWLKNLTQEGNSDLEINPAQEALVQLQDSVVWNGDVHITSSRIKLERSTFLGNVTLVKTGRANDVCKGGNTFHNTLNLTVADSGFYLTGNQEPDRFLVPCHFASIGAGFVFLSHQATGSEFYDTVQVASEGAGGIRFGFNGGTTVFAQDAFLIADTPNFSGGLLSIGHTTASNIPWSLTVTDSASIRIEPGCTFSNRLSIGAPSIRMDSSRFDAPVLIEKTGAVNDAWDGGSVFSDSLSISVTAAGAVFMGNKYPDQFQAPVTVQLDSNASLNLAHKTANNHFSAPIRFALQTNAALRFGQNGGHAILEPSASLAASDSFTEGSLLLDSCVVQFPLNLNHGYANNTVSLLQSSFQQPVNIHAGRILLEANTFEAPAAFTKTGTGFDTWRGGNAFEDVSISNSGTGTLVVGRDTVVGDQFNGTLTASNAGTGNIYLWHGPAASTVAGGLTLSASQGKIRSGLMGGSAQLQNGSAIQVDSDVDYTGTIALQRLTEDQAASSQDLTLLGDEELRLDSCHIKSPTYIETPNIFLSGNQIDARFYVTKTGPSGNISSGGNVFGSVVQITHTDSGILGMGSGAPDTFMDSLYLANTSAGSISLGHKSFGNLCNGPVTLAATGGAIRFGQDTGSVRFTSAIHCNENTVREAELSFERCVLASDTSRLLLATDPKSRIVWGAGTEVVPEIEVRAGSFRLSGARFLGTSTLVKTGVATDVSQGQNIFESDVFLSNLNTGIMRLSAGEGDRFDQNIYLAAEDGIIRFGGATNKASITAGHGVYTWPGDTLKGKLFLGSLHFEIGSALELVTDSFAQVTLGPQSEFDIPLELSCGAIGVESSVFNASAQFTNFGHPYLVSPGNSTFTDSVSFVHHGFSGWGFKDNRYEGPVYFEVTQNESNLFTGDMEVEHSVYFKDADKERLNLIVANLSFIRDSAQAINLSDTTQNLRNVSTRLPNPGNAMLQGAFFIQDTLNLQKGRLTYTETPVTLGPNVTVLGGSDSAYVTGAITQQGGLYNMLPLGSDGQYAPMAFFHEQPNQSKITVSYLATEFQSSFPNVTLSDAIDFLSPCGYWLISNPSKKGIAPVVYSKTTLPCFDGDPGDLTPLAFTAGSLIPLPNQLAQPEQSLFKSESDTLLNTNFILLAGATKTIRPFAFPLVDFFVYRNEDFAQIEFTTEFEVDNKLFELQRGIDNGVFEAIDTLPAGDNPSQPQHYFFKDSLFTTGVYRYRIRQENIFGVSTYSPVKVLNLKTNTDIYTYPSPFGADGITVSVLNNTTGAVVFKLIDVYGNVVKERTLEKDSSPMTATVFGNNYLKAGAYFLWVQTPEEETYFKMVRE